MIDEPELLELMLADQRRQVGVYQPGPYWSGYSKRITTALRSDGLRNFRARSAVGKGFADTPILDPVEMWDVSRRKLRLVKWFANFPPIRKALIGSYLARIESYFSEMTRYRDLYYDTQYGDWFERTIDSHDLPETQVGGPRDVIQLRGRTISRTYFDHLVRIWNLGAHVDISRSRSVFEIGGGFGATAHLLLHLYPGVRKFLYLDIPPVLYVGTQYLKHHFGADVIDYATTRDMAEITFSEDDTREILCICPWQLDRVSADIDLFWNSASFQEMEVLMVSNYARQIARLTQGSEDPVLGLWMYVTPNKTRILPAEDVVGGFLDWFEFTELEPAIELGSSRYLVGIRSGNTPS